MVDLRVKLFQIVKDNRIFEMTPKELALVIAEKVAFNSNGKISDEFMELMSDYLDRFYTYNYHTWKIFAKIAMIRISSGMGLYGLHYGDDFTRLNQVNPEWGLFERIMRNQTCSDMYVLKKQFNELNQKRTLDFSNLLESNALFNKACADFLLKQGAFVLQHDIDSHMQNILMYCISDYFGNGYFLSTFATNDFDADALNNHAKNLIYQFCKFEDVVKSINNKELAKKHADYLKRHWDLINYKEFASAIGINCLFPKWKIRRLLYS